jgi:DNA-binding NtrC family response regulator
MTLAKPLRILLVDDDRHMTRTLGDILDMAGHQPVQANSVDEAMAAEGVFDCVLTDIKMSGRTGLDFFREFTAKHPDVPVLLMTAYADITLVQKALREGVLAVLEKPLDIPVLLDFLNFLSDCHYVALVDDDKIFKATTAYYLRQHGMNVSEIDEPSAISQDAFREAYAVVLDMRFEHTTGIEVLRKIREAYPDLPVILVTGYAGDYQSQMEKAARELGVYACLYKPFRVDALVKLLRKIRSETLRKKINGKTEHE